MEKINDQVNSCFMTGKITGKVSFKENTNPSKNMVSFKMKNHYSFFDSMIHQVRYGNIEMTVKMFGTHVKSQVENLKTGDIVDVNGKILKHGTIYGYMVTPEKNQER